MTQWIQHTHNIDIEMKQNEEKQSTQSKKEKKEKRN